MNTPDTEEWEKEFDERFIPNDGNIPTYIENGNDLKDFIRQTISSRDTYWKERANEAYKAGQSDLIYELEKAFPEGVLEHMDDVINEAHEIAKRLQALDNLK